MDVKGVEFALVWGGVQENELRIAWALDLLLEIKSEINTNKDFEMRAFLVLFEPIYAKFL